MPSKYSIADMREIAKLREGRFLSKEYWNVNTRVLWQCKRGHTWETAPFHILQGAWCAQCVRFEEKEERLQALQTIAKSRQGKCISQKYINNRTKLQWQCEKGHRWYSMPANITGGSWCPYCARTIKHTIEEMHAIAKSRGGKCLSKKYVDNQTKLQWECSKGHRWQAKPNNVMASQSWCPYCAEVVKYTIEEMYVIAKSKGGRCLSKKYVNERTKLKWECKEGHRWEAIPGSIVIGHWCRRCAQRANSRTIRSL